MDAALSVILAPLGFLCKANPGHLQIGGSPLKGRAAAQRNRKSRFNTLTAFNMFKCVEMDVLGIAYSEFSDAEREAVVQAHQRSDRVKEDIIQTFYKGIRHKLHSTFGNPKADVLVDKDPHFTRSNFGSVIRLRLA